MANSSVYDRFLEIDNILFEEGVELSQEAKEKIYDILFDMDKDIRDGLK